MTTTTNDDNLQMGEELRIRRPSINSVAAQLRESYPHLNREARKRLARQLVKP